MPVKDSWAWDSAGQSQQQTTSADGTRNPVRGKSMTSSEWPIQPRRQSQEHIRRLCGKGPQSLAENAVGRVSNRNVETARQRIQVSYQEGARGERSEHTQIISERHNNAHALPELDFSILKQPHDYVYNQTKNSKLSNIHGRPPTRHVVPATGATRAGARYPQ
jgi:hypothetical protein